MSNDSRSGSGSGDRPVVRAQRRRRVSDSGAPRQRAEAPRREGRQPQRPAGGSSFSSQSGSSSYGGGGSSSSQRPSAGGGMLGGLLGSLLGGLLSGGGSTRAGTGGRGCGCSPRALILLAGLALLALCALYAISQGLGGMGDLTGQQIEQQAPTAGSLPLDPVQPTAPAPTAVPPTRVAPTAAVAPTRQPAAPGTGSGDTWLVMLYQDADDQVLERDIYVDLNEAERVGSTEQVRIVSQIDRFRGGYAADGDWYGTRRYLVTRDADLERVGSQLLEEIPEANMSDGQTLVDFVTWAMATYPSDRYALIMSDHGIGWPGGWSDPDPQSRANSSAPLASALGNQLYLNELDGALQAIRQQTGVDRLDLVGMDACLMAQLEVYSMLAPHARYAVASEETEPALGWAYASFLRDLTANPGMDTSELASRIVNSYVREDERIVDDQARADLLKQSAPMGGMFGFSLPSVDQIASQMGQAVTLSAVDLDAVNTLTNRVNEFALALQGADQRLVAKARGYAQSYTSVFGSNVPASYIDLGHLAMLIGQNSSGAVQQAARNVVDALRNAVVAETHGPGKPGSTGIAIYFPNSQLFGIPQTGPQSYTAIASQFAGTSLWDDYLTYHYTGRTFTADALEAVVPDAGATVLAPGGQDLSISAVSTSSNAVSIGDTVLLSADITSDNLAHVLLFAGYVDQAAGSLMVIDMDYLEAQETREIEGVYYPVWPEGDFTLEFEWEPIVWYLSDGTNQALATFKPQNYGASPEQAVYTVDGIYTFTDGTRRLARLYLMDGMLQRVFAFAGEDFNSAPREVHPSTGDSFTVLEEWLDLNEQGRVEKRAYEQGDTLTFGNQMFTYGVMDAPAGGYLVGFIAQDLDGISQQAYAQITVR
ncbi:MAG: clostripain-related cysteine peptidase [Anaerolineae bacterium]|jgi:hypothetical protein|nr:hypothetical protein [Chloroflexota bacterium]